MRRGTKHGIEPVGRALFNGLQGLKLNYHGFARSSTQPGILFTSNVLYPGLPLLHGIFAKQALILPGEAALTDKWV